ncbi:MAG: sigma-70 family RNA polymerase sigma factor [bacterium]|nr:sigma-70 family RNA polymerase sigma factor [bacterium]
MKLETLLAQAVADEASFKLIYEMTTDKVFRYFLARTGNRHESLDLTQNTYTELWKSLSKFVYRSDEHFYGYLFTIARRQMMKSWRLFKANVSLEQAEDIIVAGDNREDYRKLFAGVDTLPHKQKLVLRLRYFSDFSFAEIALALSITESNAKVLHHRAIEALQTIKQFYV